MPKRAESLPKVRSVTSSAADTAETMAGSRQSAGKTQCQVRDEYDLTSLVGLRTLARNGVVECTDEDEEVTVEVLRLDELMASVAVARCLMPIRLRGWEIKAMRRIMKKTLAELAKKLDERTAPETLSRWESEAQPMGGYAEKLLRLLVCEELRKAAPGVDYNAGMIAELRVLDPWRVNPDYEIPYIELGLIKIRERSGSIIEAWDARMAA